MYALNFVKSALETYQEISSVYQIAENIERMFKKKLLVKFWILAELRVF